MTRVSIAMVLAATACFAQASAEPSSAAPASRWNIGERVPAFTYFDLAGRPLSSTEEPGRITAVLFVSAKCPISNAYADRMSALYRAYSAKGVRFIFLNANSNEDVTEVARHMKEVEFPFVVYRDSGNRVADAAGAQMTPESFVIDGQGALRYHGAIDDSQNEARIKRHGLRDALDALFEGRAVATPEIKAFGCTIKRVLKKS